MAVLQRKIYVSGLIMWLLYVFLFPTWIGYSHSQVVGLECNHAPIWNAPSPIRWPWSIGDQASFAKIAFGRVFVRWSIGIIFFGLFLGVTSQVYRSKVPDPVISTGLSVTLGLLIAWMFILALGLFSMGPAETEVLLITILSAGALGGLVNGIRQNQKSRYRLKSRPEVIALSAAATRFALKGRIRILFVARVVAALALIIACVCAVLSGLGLDPKIAGTWLFASIAVFSCIKLDRWQPGWGGIVLCGLALISVVMISFFFVLEPPRFDVFALALSCLCVGFPMFVIGTLLFLSAQRQLSRLDYVWWIEFVLAAIVTGYFLWHTGATIERIAIEWLHWNLGLDI